ncbi:hypothetical protein HanHA300_Chr00c0061g0700241 [Helianthus annuus]|nr:hypothetical protein HanIR_Chr03g0101911 [Helianthus annuus]KAJ0638690.1 hypothetical protein HanHA300_Chr00c0061g0700241 [Helianthus annuus]KAJ0766872.1 hypothetical protein HanLR1_Chr03g0082591 [Helianthus annuus]KAJ0772732.1 hypothetical protein HanOQP8_Chr03g0090801 [Helianthus annuus]KAJ0942247.1 hypothetical protein HanPSC8_Chr03g0089731 [Helianthus annuus]
MENIRAAQECLAKEKADFEAYKRTEEWSVVAANKQVRSLTKLLSQERKLWNEAYASDNDKFYRPRQKIINLKAVNAGLEKKKPQLLRQWKKPSLRALLLLRQWRKPTLRAIEYRYHTESSIQLEDAKALNADLNVDRQWMHDYGVVYIANAILDAPKVDAKVAALRAKVRDAGYKVGYTEYLTHVNVASDKKFTDEQCHVHKVDTKGELEAASQAYNTLVIPILAQVEECLAADDYVDRLRHLFELEENAEGETEGEGQG